MSGKTSISAAKSFRKETVAALALLLGVCFAGVIPADAAGKVGSGVAQSKHNLSISGSGALRANAVSTDTAAGEMCIFCHTPHSAGRTAALWNHSDSSTTYIPYGSSTTKAIIGQRHRQDQGWGGFRRARRRARCQRGRRQDFADHLRI